MGILPDLWRLLRICAVILLGAVMPGDAAGDEPQTWAGPRLEKARALLDGALNFNAGRKGRVPRAISAAVGVNGRLAYSDGRGFARGSVPATADTVYRIGSITKQFLAAAVLNAIGERKLMSPSGALLTLDSKVSEVFADAAGWDEEGRPVLTLRALITMRSDLTNFTRKPPNELDPWGAVHAPELRRALVRLRRQSGDGSFAYSNTGYFLLSEILRMAHAGTSYGGAMHDFAIARAGLTNTGFTEEARLAALLAEPAYGRRPAFIQPDWLQGSADMLSSATDLFKWNAALFQGAVLDREALREMLSDAARVDVWTYYGMGWFISHKDGIDTYFHSGSVPGYTGLNAVYRFSSGVWVSVSLLTNSDGVEDLDALADSLAELARADH